MAIYLRPHPLSLWKGAPPSRKERPVYSEPKKNKKEENAERWLLIIITRNGLIRLCLETGIRGFVCSQFHKD